MSSEETLPSIVPILLELRARGKPPFLVRNLKYVKAYKNRARNRVWDLAWTHSPHPSITAARHLVLRVRPSRCILATNVVTCLLNIIDPLPYPTQPHLYQPYLATLRVSLHVRQRDAHVITFNTTNARIRLWPQEHHPIFQQHHFQLEDLPISEAFDLSAVVPLLATNPAALSLTVELWASNTPKRPRGAPTLLGEVLIWDCQKSKHGSAIPNAVVKLPLGFIEHGNAHIPTEFIRRGAQARPVSLEASVMRKFEQMGIQTQRKAGFQSEDMEIEHNTAGSITLELTGSVEKAITQALTEDKPHVTVQLKYTSPDEPSWHGIIRNDFLCPWCHRNCHRYRALLAHFQVEHDDMKFAVQGGGTTARLANRAGSMPISLEFTVQRVSKVADDDETRLKRKRMQRATPSGTITRDASEIYDDYIYANPQRFGSYMTSTQPKLQSSTVGETTKPVVDVDQEDGMSSAAPTEYSDENQDIISFVRKELGDTCKVCYREHGRDYNGKADFCSEWCEISFRKKERSNKEGSDEDDVPLLSLATVPRPRKVNYKEALGHLKLYHVVSVSEARPEHFDDDDPDSEEEVDQTWRLNLSLERVRYLEGVSAKEKVLWMMWNKYAHENYPLPSSYGERYTRYTVELFALEYGTRIKRFKLRLVFFGFLRALHTHGLIDSVAIKSIMMCLDGKKRRRDVQASARVIPDRNGMEGNGRRGQRGKGRAKSNRSGNHGGA